VKFAHFAHVWGKTGMTPHDRYEQLWRELELADGLGFDYGFCVEHHFRPHESWSSAPSMYVAAAGARTKTMRIGAMGYIVPLYNSLRLAEEIALADQMLGGRFEIGLVPGISPGYFAPFGLDYDARKTPTLEYVDYLRAAFGPQPFSFHGKHHNTDEVTLAVLPAQKPHPPMWMQSRDPETLEFIARNGMNTGYFLVYPRDEAAPRYRKFLGDWAAAGWANAPRIGYSTVVYVDETDQKALDTALQQAARAYEGFLPPVDEPGTDLQARAHKHAEMFITRGEHGAAEIMANLFDPDYILENDLMFIGDPDTVTAKLKDAAASGMFNTFLGEFNFGDLAEDDLMRSIRLFGEHVVPALGDFEPF
jgi:alkanesulfonate monooxygenase SsuD/methylene tetrahydromethanopterin reductase-like flavin-dependent oxidoreductase (luciferase family)